jgi:hypothetical protein
MSSRLKLSTIKKPDDVRDIELSEVNNPGSWISFIHTQVPTMHDDDVLANQSTASLRRAF